jgi:hypothetical protein
VVELLRVIHGQDADGRPPHLGPTENQQAGQLEVVGPALPAWVKQWRQHTRFWIDAGHVGAFVQIAVLACGGEIRRLGQPTVLTGHDVLHLELVEVRDVPRDAAILAPVIGAGADPLAEGG